MTQPEIDAFLAGSTHMVVGALAADGWPIGTLASTAYVDGRLAVHFADHDPVAARLADDPRLCCLWDEHATYFEIQGVVVHGTLAADGETVEVGKVISFDFGRLRAP